MTPNSAARMRLRLPLLLVFVMVVPSAARPSAGADEGPVIAAVRAQDAAVVRAALAQGEDVNARQPDGATALHWASFRDDAEIAERLLTAGADVNAANDLGATPLWLAADNGSAAMVARLLAAGAAPDVRLPEGETPVMTASRTGNVDAVRLLVAAGADVNVAEETRGQTALMWAVAQGHSGVVDVLIAHGADVSARSRPRPRMMFSDSVNGAQYDQGFVWNQGEFTPLLFAARHGRIAAARSLLAAGADVDDPAPTGASPLVVATHSGEGEFATYLLDQGADPLQMGAGYNALHAAILRGDEPLVEALLRHGADPNVRLATGTPQRRTSADWAFDPALVSATPYWLAAYYREPNIMRDLVAAGADPRLTTLELWRPVYKRAGGVGPPHMAGGFVPSGVAVIRGDSGRRRFFLDETIRDPNVGEREALAAFTVALEFGADVDATDHNGGAAIHRAAQRNLTTVVQLLARRGADINLLDGSGRSALQLADAAAAGRLRSQVAAARAPSGNTADVLRELGAMEPEQK
ncbi:MAG: ankyrin repeat domain-containing protein [Vicinamibacterales bacterium]|nr:ankyrin repeat domain-containing protein [Vicinamibacterales bacterium]